MARRCISFTLFSVMHLRLEYGLKNLFSIQIEGKFCGFSCVDLICSNWDTYFYLILIFFKLRVWWTYNLLYLLMLPETIFKTDEDRGCISYGGRIISIFICYVNYNGIRKLVSLLPIMSNHTEIWRLVPFVCLVFTLLRWSIMKFTFIN